jgi:hypothetical protein
VGAFVPSTGCKDVVVGLISTARAIACAIQSKLVLVGADGSVVEDTMDKPGKLHQCVFFQINNL